MTFFDVIMIYQAKIFLSAIIFQPGVCIGSCIKFFLSFRTIIFENDNTVSGDFFFVLLTIFLALFKRLASFAEADLRLLQHPRWSAL